MTEQTQTEEQSNLSGGEQLTNIMLHLDFLFRLMQSVLWTVQSWLYQWQKNGRFSLQPPKSILMYDSDGKAQDILKDYKIHNMHFGASLEMVGGKAELLHSVLVPASQFDYADAVLNQHGVPVLSEAGTKRGYTMRQPRDYGERQPRQQTAQRKQAKLGKTYS